MSVHRASVYTVSRRLHVRFGSTSSPHVRVYILLAQMPSGRHSAD